MYKTLIVVDQDSLDLVESIPGCITFDTYLKEYPKYNEPKTRIINLCDTERYLSEGYYCSLLAEARNHNVLPSIKTINRLRVLAEEDDIPELHREIAMLPFDVPQESFIFFGCVENAGLSGIATQLFSRYPSPILKLVIQREGDAVRAKVSRVSLSSLNVVDRAHFCGRLREFTVNVWRTSSRQKRHRWDMAILMNPEEKVPPSNKEALTRFVKAAAKHGIHAELLTIDKIQNIAYYDALFVRETTAIDHHTYRLVAKAEAQGLVVMDDSASILRCCNKVFLHDAFSYQKVPSPRTELVNELSEESLNHLEQNFTYPLVLKMPEGSFSNGVYKVANRQELSDRLAYLFEKSALVLAQEYLYTEFDWRIGILNGRAIYACRYLMARNHWQIYNHSAKRFVSGGFETLPTFEVPRCVLDAALKAAKVVGTGLYGVDVKEIDKKAYVLEVNDNPSIDHKVEDAYLGSELYMQIMGEFQRRLELRGR